MIYILYIYIIYKAVYLKRPRTMSVLPASAMVRRNRSLFSFSFIDDTPCTSPIFVTWVRHTV